MKPTHIEHIGIAVNSIADAIPFYENVLGLKCYNIEEVAEQKVKTAFFMLGQTKIELLEVVHVDVNQPVLDAGPLQETLQRRGIHSSPV